MITVGDTLETYEDYGVSPSPDYPSPIESITEISATVTGKNLFNKYGDFTYGSTNNRTSLQSDGTILSTSNFGGSRSSGLLIGNIKSNTDYIISGILVSADGTSIANNAVIQVLTTSNTLIKQFYIKTSATKPFNFSFSFNSGENTSFWISLNGWNSTTEGTTNTIFDNIQLEEGTVATSYEEYKSNSLTINLQGNELCSLPDGTKDELVVENGRAKIIKRVDKIILNGSEKWGQNVNQTKDNTSYYYSYVLDNLAKKGSQVGTLRSNFFINQETYNADREGISMSAAAPYLRLRINTSIASTAEKLLTWLSTHNVEVYYALETPIDIEITDPTLLAQLNVLEQITQYKHTYITITGNDLTPEADFTYINNVVINNTDSVLGKDTYWNDEVPTQQDLPSKAQEGEIRIVQDTEDVYIYNGTKWVPFDKNSEVDLSNYLTKDNTTPWMPTGPFNPSTKKYVDDSVGGIHVPTKTSQLQNDSNFVIKTTNELTNYYTKNNTYTKNEVDALVASGGGTSELAAIKLTGTEENPIILNTLSPGFYHINEFYKYKESSSDVNWTDGKPIIVLVHKKYYSSASGNYSDNFSKILFTDDYSEDFPNRDILSIYTISDSQSGEYAKESLGSGGSIERELATFEGDGSTTTFTYHLQGAPSYLQTFFIPQVQFYYVEDMSTMTMKPVLADYNVNPSTGIIEINLDFIMPESTGLIMTVTY